MADDRRGRGALAHARPNAMVASAAVLSDKRLPVRRMETWQEEAWAYYDTIGELRYGVTYISNALSRVRLVAASPGTPDNPSPQALPDGPAVDAMARLAGGTVGQAQMMQAFGVNLTVPGMCYLVGEPSETGETWNVYAPDVLRQQGGSGAEYQVQTDDSQWRALDPESLVVQVWRPSRRFPWQPDSAVRAVLPVLNELDLLNKRVIADAISRLAGAGILVVPSEAEFPKARPDDPDEDPFTESLVTSMTVPIMNRESASAVVPLTVRVPAAYASAFNLITTSTPFDERLLDLRTAAIGRLAVGLDLPPEAVLGVADVNHWTAWQVEESAIKLHVDPTAELICEGLTVGYLAPALAAVGLDPTSAVVWYDDAELRAQPDRSGRAVDLYDRGELSGDAARRETGFAETDAPSDDELRKQVVVHTAMTRPDLLPNVMQYLDRVLATGDATDDLPVPGGTTPSSPSGTSPTGGPGTGPVIGPPGTGPNPIGTVGPGAPVTSSARMPDALLAACDQLVARALERAGNKLRRLAGDGLDPDCGPMTAHQCVDAEVVAGANMDDLMRGAWERLPDIAQRYGVESVGLRRALDGYTRHLLAAGTPHTFETLSASFGYAST